MQAAATPGNTRPNPQRPSSPLPFEDAPPHHSVPPPVREASCSQPTCRLHSRAVKRLHTGFHRTSQPARHLSHHNLLAELASLQPVR